MKPKITCAALLMAFSLNLLAQTAPPPPPPPPPPESKSGGNYSHTAFQIAPAEPAAPTSEAVDWLNRIEFDEIFSFEQE